MSRPRIRSIKPEFWTDGKIRRLSDSAALFFIALWNHCDDAGYFAIDPWELSLKTARWRSQDISKMLSSLLRRGLIRTSTELGVGFVEGWSHQRIDKPSTSKWQGVEIKWDVTSDFDDTSTTPPRQIGSDRAGSDRKGSERMVALASSETPRAREKADPNGVTPVALTWQAYRDAFTERHGSPPPWNAKIAGQLKSLTCRMPQAEAPEVARFYVMSNDAYCLKARHPLGLLLRDAEKWHVDWQMGRSITTHEARNVELKQHNANVWGAVAAKYASREGGTNGNDG